MALNNCILFTKEYIKTTSKNVTNTGKSWWQVIEKDGSLKKKRKTWILLQNGDATVKHTLNIMRYWDTAFKKYRCFA